LERSPSGRSENEKINSGMKSSSEGGMKSTTTTASGIIRPDSYYYHCGHGNAPVLRVFDRLKTVGRRDDDDSDCVHHTVMVTISVFNAKLAMIMLFGKELSSVCSLLVLIQV
jgi:hypothetical protein